MRKGLSLSIFERLFLLTLPMTSAFSFAGGWVNPPIIFAFFLVATFHFEFLIKRRVYFDSGRETLTVVIFLSIALISFLINSLLRGVSSKSITHLIAYNFSFGFYYLFFRPIWVRTVERGLLVDVFKFVYQGVLISSVFGISEFFLKNFYGIALDELLPRALVASDYAPAVFGEKIRIRSFAEESGHFALYLELLAPLGFCYLVAVKRSFFNKLLYIFIVLAALTLTFSSMAFVLIPISVVLFFFVPFFIKALVYRRIDKIEIGYLLVIATLTFAVAVYLVSSEAISNILSEVVFGKLSSASADDRTGRIYGILAVYKDANFFQYLFGFSPGAYESLRIESVVSWIFNIFLETGILGLLVFILFLFFHLKKALSFKNNLLKTAFLSSFFMGVSHYFFVGNYWFPWIWVVLGLIDGITTVENSYEEEVGIYRS